MSTNYAPDTARPRQRCPFPWLKLEREAYCLSCLKGSRRRNDGYVNDLIIGRYLAPSERMITKHRDTKPTPQANRCNSIAFTISITISIEVTVTSLTRSVDCNHLLNSPYTHSLLLLSHPLLTPGGGGFGKLQI